MSDNFTYKYASGAEVTIRATENASGRPSVYTIHVNAQVVDSAGNAVNASNPLQIAVGDGVTVMGIDVDGSINVIEREVREFQKAILEQLKLITMHLSELSGIDVEE